ncbi:hypothetical protein [Bradyrhizobium sp. B117]|uniref:hypothetical protein n=1 Tax=Bradyrhizobium sp. B117 TaxID=3140246 RepID=UPI0031846124
MDPEQRVAKALEDAQGIRARYVEPGPRDREQTRNQLLDVLDDGAVVQALKDSKMEKPTAEQLAELKRLNAIARCRTNGRSSLRRKKPRSGSAI